MAEQTEKKEEGVEWDSEEEESQEEKVQWAEIPDYRKPKDKNQEELDSSLELASELEGIRQDQDNPLYDNWNLDESKFYRAFKKNGSERREYLDEVEAAKDLDKPSQHVYICDISEMSNPNFIKVVKNLRVGLSGRIRGLEESLKFTLHRRPQVVFTATCEPAEDLEDEVKGRVKELAEKGKDVFVFGRCYMKGIEPHMTYIDVKDPEDVNFEDI